MQTHYIPIPISLLRLKYLGEFANNIVRVTDDSFGYDHVDDRHNDDVVSETRFDGSRHVRHVRHVQNDSLDKQHRHHKQIDGKHYKPDDSIHRKPDDGKHYRHDDDADMHHKTNWSNNATVEISNRRVVDTNHQDYYNLQRQYSHSIPYNDSASMIPTNTATATTAGTSGTSTSTTATTASTATSGIYQEDIDGGDALVTKLSFDEDIEILSKKLHLKILERQVRAAQIALHSQWHKEDL